MDDKGKSRSAEQPQQPQPATPATPAQPVQKPTPQPTPLEGEDPGVPEGPGRKP